MESASASSSSLMNCAVSGEIRVFRRWIHPRWTEVFPSSGIDVYKRQGKGLTYGGSLIRQEAAGFGTIYFLARMLEHQEMCIRDRVQSIFFRRR